MVIYRIRPMRHARSIWSWRRSPSTGACAIAKSSAKLQSAAVRRGQGQPAREARQLARLLAHVKSEGTREVQVQRYKGLGEMNAEQLWETTMNAETRTLLKVSVEDLVQTRTDLLDADGRGRGEPPQVYRRERARRSQSGRLEQVRTLIYSGGSFRRWSCPRSEYSGTHVRTIMCWWARAPNLVKPRKSV